MPTCPAWPGTLLSTAGRRGGPRRRWAWITPGTTTGRPAVMPGGWKTWPRGPLHGLLDRERAAIAGLFDAWGEIDRSHRKLAHRGSRIGLVHVSESTCAVCWPRRPGRGGPTAPRVGPGRAVAGLAGVEAQPRAGLRLHPLTQARRASIAILDVVSRKWLATLTSAEETSTRSRPRSSPPWTSRTCSRPPTSGPAPRCARRSPAASRPRPQDKR